MLTGNWPPEGRTWRRKRWSPQTKKTEIVLLPALTAYRALALVVVYERVLRGEAVDDGSGLDAAFAACVVDTGEASTRPELWSYTSIWLPFGRIRLDEDAMAEAERSSCAVPAASARAGYVAAGGCGVRGHRSGDEHECRQRECRCQQADRQSHLISSLSGTVRV